MASNHAAWNDASEAREVSGAYAPRKRAGVLELDMGDGVVLYDPDSSLVHHLNPSASIAWQLSDGDACVAQLALEIAEEYRLDREEILHQMVEVVAELDALGLVKDARG